MSTSRILGRPLAILMALALVLAGCGGGGGGTSTTYTIGGTLSGLASGQQVILENNGDDPLTLSADGSFTFATEVADDGSYLVTVATQPAGQTCTVGNACGTGVTSNVTNVSVVCSGTTYTISGTISGLTDGQEVTLKNNCGDPLVVDADGSFTFSVPVAGNGGYSVTVGTQPTGGTCTVSTGSGTNVTGDVTSVGVVCSATTYTIGGTLSGLASGQQVTLKNNDGDDLTISANGGFAFATPVAYNGSYAVTVGTQPTGQTCTVSSGSGSNVTANVTSVSVACSATTYTIGGTLSGLASGQQVILKNNNTDPLTLSADGNFTFATALAYNSSYAVTVGTQPSGQTCTVSNGTGSNLAANVTNVGVSCATLSYSTVQVLYSFGNTPDGQYPYGALVQGSDGNLYGTTSGGGADGLGTLFKITPSGTVTILYSFAGGADGSGPSNALYQASPGVFYGTTYYGGSNGGGTFFKLVTDGTSAGTTKTVLHAFGAVGDGQYPETDLIRDASGDFYGTTYEGGNNDKGVVYKIVTDGTIGGTSERVIHSFDYTPDGLSPRASLIKAMDGNFYGVTGYGGTYGKGTFFMITSDGTTETVLLSFGSGTDGQYPYGGLVQDGSGNFYGTTSQGPTSAYFGTFFKIATDGTPGNTTETVLYTFGSKANDAKTPFGKIFRSTAGDFYGTTMYGGASGLGAVYKIVTNGTAGGTTETVLHSFAGAPDGNQPWAGLIQGSNGVLYGTTYSGGSNSGFSNRGAVFTVQ